IARCSCRLDERGARIRSGPHSRVEINPLLPMSGEATAGIPPPLDSDDDDVAWALQTAAVQWKRGAFADAIVWLRRAVDSAIQAGQAERASDLSGAAWRLTERMLAQADAVITAPPASEPNDVDDLL